MNRIQSNLVLHPKRVLPALLAAASLATAGLSSAPAAPAAPTRPNILFVFADDHAYQAIGAYGSKINQTPHIDRLAREGMRFDRCLVHNSICGPSRAGIFTSKYSHVNGFFRNGNKFDGSQQTYPKLLQQAGYQTAVIGKWHLESDPTGFDHWEILIGQGPYYNPPTIRNGERLKYTGYTTDLITDLTLDWLQKGRDPNKPFMLCYWHKAPHREWAPHPRHFKLYDDVTIPEPETLFDDYSGRGTPARTQDMTIAKTMTNRDLKLVPPPNLTPEQLEAWNAYYEPRNEAFRQANLQGADLVRWKYQRYIKDYLRCVAALDEGLGRVLNYLDETGLAANTVVVYSSDQGFYLGEHGWFDKRWIYEESVRMPLVIKWPGQTKPGSANRDLVANLDFGPTFLEMAGVPVPAGLHGRSLVPILRGQTPSDWRKSFYYHYYEFPGAHSVRRHYGVVTDRYKLVHFYEPEINEWEMFDLQTDPRELRSVFGAPSHAAVQKELETELARLRAELQVPPDETGRPARPKQAGPAAN